MGLPPDAKRRQGVKCGSEPSSSLTEELSRVPPERSHEKGTLTPHRRHYSFTPVSKPARNDFGRSYVLIFNIWSFLGWTWVLEQSIHEIMLSTGLAVSTPTTLPPMKTYNIVAGMSTPAESSGFVQKVMLVQSLAALEIVNSGLGLVKSNLATTVMQVFSRLWIVWVILPAFPTLGGSAVYRTMTFAWSVTEVIRYGHYATGLMNLKSNLLEWLRYSTFFLLYPLGAGSEALIMYFASRMAKQSASQTWLANLLLAFVCAWPPALALMMSHMIRQRKKYLSRRAEKTT